MVTILEAIDDAFGTSTPLSERRVNPTALQQIIEKSRGEVESKKGAYFGFDPKRKNLCWAPIVKEASLGERRILVVNSQSQDYGRFYQDGREFTTPAMIINQDTIVDAGIARDNFKDSVFRYTFEMPRLLQSWAKKAQENCDVGDCLFNHYLTLRANSLFYKAHPNQPYNKVEEDYVQALTEAHARYLHPAELSFDNAQEYLKLIAEFLKKAEPLSHLAFIDNPRMIDFFSEKRKSKYEILTSSPEEIALQF